MLPHFRTRMFNSCVTAIFSIAFGGNLSYPRFPLESTCNPINMMPLPPLQYVSGVIPSI